MIFKSRLFGDHSISSKTHWSSFLFKYLLNLFAVCLGSLSCWKVKRGPINRLPDCMAWWMKICLYFSAFIIPSILTKSPTPPAEIQPQTCTDPPPWSTVGCKHGSCNSFPLLLRTYWPLVASRNLQLWLVTQQHLPFVRIPVVVFSRILQSFTATLLWRPFRTRVLCIVDKCTCVSKFEQVAQQEPYLYFILSINDITLRYFSSLFVSFLGRPLLGLSSTCPVSWCFFNSAWIPHLDTPVWREISACDFPCSSNITTLCLVTVNIFPIFGWKQNLYHA